MALPRMPSLLIVSTSVEHTCCIWWNLRSCFGFVTSSPTIVWMTPILPLSAPPRNRPTSAIQKFREKPTIRREAIVPMQPMIRTGLRPSRSESPPQYMPVIDSAKAKADMSRPAKKEALFGSPTWNCRTSFHAYGNIDVSAIGSATLTSAA